MICIHHNDLDGRCAAAIVAKRYPDCMFIETDYKDPVPDIDFLLGQDIIIVDFSYKTEQFNMIYAAAKSVVWIDHHATAKDYPYQSVPGLRDFKDKSMSGCELTWNYFYPYAKIPQAVLLVGDYDKWAHKLKDSKLFYEGMKLEENGPSSQIWNFLLSDNDMLPTIIQNGITSMRYRDNYCESLCKDFGYNTSFEGYHVYACNQQKFGSQGFGKRMMVYPFCVAYIHNGHKFIVSLYSENKDINVGEIAKRYGGGGHKGAAGFVCDELPFCKQ